MTAQGCAVVIEDDTDVAELISVVLEQAGLRVVLAHTAHEGLEAVREHNPLLTTLDVNLPGFDGYAVARRLREFSDTYLIMVTGLVQEIDVIRGFEAGADDYLVKPFRPRELRARADAMMRRYQRWITQPASEGPGDAPATPAPEADTSWATVALEELTAGSTPVTAPAEAPAPPVAPAPPAVPDVPDVPAADVLESGAIVAHLRSRSLTVEGRSVHLDAMEFDLLVSLMESGTRVRSKAELALTLRGEGAVPARFVNEAEKRQVDARIAELRVKLGDSADSPRYIAPVKGVGYRMV